MGTGSYVLAAALALVVAVALLRRLLDGRFRGTHAVRGVAASARDVDPASAVLVGTPFADQLGERASLVQFSTAFCAPCRATRRILAEVADLVPGVTHVEIDAEHHLELVRRVGVFRTPTTLVLDAVGREVSRASGAPTRDQVLAAVSAAIDD